MYRSCAYHWCFARTDSISFYGWRQQYGIVSSSIAIVVDVVTRHFGVSWIDRGVLVIAIGVVADVSSWWIGGATEERKCCVAIPVAVSIGVKRLCRPTQVFGTMQGNIVQPDIAQRTISLDAHKTELQNRSIAVFAQTQGSTQPLVALIAFAFPE